MAKRVLSWFLEGLILAALLWLVFILAGRALRKIAIAQIIELTNTRIKAESVDFNLDGSVFIEKLIVSPHQEQKYDDAILKAKTVYARFSVVSLLLLRPRLKEIKVNDFVFNALHDLDTGRWNIAALKIRAPKGTSGKMPLVRLEGGTLQYSKISNGRPRVVAAVPLEARFGFDEETQDGYSFKITTAAQLADSAKSKLTGFWRPGMITIAGGISSADVPAFERVWTINLLAAELTYGRGNAYSLKLTIKDLHSKHRTEGEQVIFEEPVFLQKFRAFGALQRFFNRYDPSGQVDIKLEASGLLDRLGESKLAGRVHCRDVSICDRRFDYPIGHIVGRIDFTENDWLLNNLCGWHNDVKLFFNGFSSDFGPERQYKIQITSDNMALDEDLYNALSPGQKKLWSDFSPSGLAAINYCLSRRRQEDKRKALAVELLGAEAACRYFPYPLKNLTGMLFFERDAIVVSDVVSRTNGQEIILNGQIWPDQNADRLSYRLSIHSQQSHLGHDLFDVLPPTAKNIISKLQPKGKINYSVELDGTEPNDYPDYKVIVDCLGNSVNFEQFPYPLKDITGRIIVTNDSIKLQNITAAAADNVQLTPDTSVIKMNGEITLADKTFSNGSFRLSAGDIFLDERLGIALPEDIRDFYFKLSPTGRFDVNNINIEIFNAADGEKYIDFAGDIIFKGCNFSTSPAVNELDMVLKTGGLYKTGDGFCDGWARLIKGSFRIKDKSLTGLKANIHYDYELRNWQSKNLVADCYDGKVTGKFELKAAQKHPDKAALEYVLQTGFDDIDLKQFLSTTEPSLTEDRAPTVRKRSESNEMRLAVPSDISGEQTGHNSCTSGRMSGSLSVAGRFGNEYSRIGRCRLTISDMQVGKLSPLAKLLGVLKLTEPKDFAFERMFVDSYIKNNELFFEKFDLSGEAAAFNGSGVMDLKTQDIHLTLTARGRRPATAEPSVLQSLTEGLAQAFVRMKVTGNLYDPQVTTTALPVIKEALQILGTKQSRPKP